MRDGITGRGVDGYGDLGTPPRAGSPYAQPRGDGINAQGVEGFGDLGTPPRTDSPRGHNRADREVHEGEHRKPTLGQKIIGAHLTCSFCRVCFSGAVR